MIKNTNQNIFKIHFYLENSKHSIKDATLINGHTEFSAYVKELTKILGASIDIKIVPYEEGGFKHCIEFIGENSAALTIISGIIIAVFSGAAWSLYQRPLLNQQEEINKTDIEIKKLELEKIKIELSRLQKIENPSELISNSPIPNNENLLLHLEDCPSPESIIPLLKENKKLLKRLSNFYEAINKDDEVLAIGYSFKDHQKETIIKNDLFNHFIIESSLLADEKKHNSIIEITAPVLNGKNIKWHGIYEEHAIHFNINDSSFTEKVLKREILFKNGFRIKCLLTIKRKINNIGEIEIYEYLAESVIPIKEKNN